MCDLNHFFIHLLSSKTYKDINFYVTFLYSYNNNYKEYLNFDHFNFKNNIVFYKFLYHRNILNTLNHKKLLENHTWAIFGEKTNKINIKLFNTLKPPKLKNVFQFVSNYIEIDLTKTQGILKNYKKKEIKAQLKYYKKYNENHAKILKIKDMIKWLETHSIKKKKLYLNFKYSNIKTFDNVFKIKLELYKLKINNKTSSWIEKKNVYNKSMLNIWEIINIYNNKNKTITNIKFNKSIKIKWPQQQCTTKNLNNLVIIKNLQYGNIWDNIKNLQKNENYNITTNQINLKKKLYNIVYIKTNPNLEHSKAYSKKNNNIDRLYNAIKNSEKLKPYTTNINKIPIKQTKIDNAMEINQTNYLLIKHKHTNSKYIIEIVVEKKIKTKIKEIAPVTNLTNFVEKKTINKNNHQPNKFFKINWAFWEDIKNFEIQNIKKTKTTSFDINKIKPWKKKYKTITKLYYDTNTEDYHWTIKTILVLLIVTPLLIFNLEN